MKEYKILVGNKITVIKDLTWAKEVAKRESQVNFRATILDGNERIARYEWGKEI